MHTIATILAKCPHQVNACHQAKALGIDQALLAGTPFTALGGKRVRCREGLLRFKLGSAWRLLYQITATGYAPCALVSRQCFERELKRRRPIKAYNLSSQEKHP
ncbi:hypothetical protein PH586_14805 [Pseudomonas sp. SA3-5]|uniref:ParE-like toxin domain-containing protein n=1 Tax=Pseudomonas aestuarii TaxID=3018340 RepID=A0ABT4XHN2_9PSED|nr:hypothetical protein [Pseudomonas aestuarii]MDA7087658.1 hypothetical protein [Pseudomonas aestuarii]